MILEHSSSALVARLEVDLFATPSEDFGFTDRFVRKLFFDNVYCAEKYLREIRPWRPGSQRSKATRPLDSAKITATEDSLIAEHQQMMQSWERPLMQRMARGICRRGCTVLEVGFGLGISANEIQQIGPRKHVIVEAHPQIADAARAWRMRHDSDVEIIESRWEKADLAERLFDAVLFDAYPCDEVEISENLEYGRTAAERFFPVAEKVTGPGGRFTFYTGCEMGLLLRLQDELFLRFGKLCLERVGNLEPPNDCNYWISPEMVVVVAQKAAGDGVSWNLD
jgi:guanidinoacetate N-methyltransferase